MKSILIRLISGLINISLFPMVNWTIEVDKQSPMCCGGSTDFIGCHTSLFGEKLFYQCDQCKKVFAITNKHNTPYVCMLFHMWLMIFMPKIGETNQDDK